MTALLAAPWPILAAVCLFAGALIGCGIWSLLRVLGDYWHHLEVAREQRIAREFLDPNDFGADDTYDPTKETQA